MKLSTRKQLLEEASKVLSELQKDGDSRLYTPEEYKQLVTLSGEILNHVYVINRVASELDKRVKDVRRKLTSNWDRERGMASLRETDAIVLVKTIETGTNNKQLVKITEKLSKSLAELVKVLG